MESGSSARTTASFESPHAAMLNRTRPALLSVVIALSPTVAAAQVTWRASVSSAGVQGDMSSSEGHVSSDGRYVVFLSSATNLVANDTNACSDIFLHDHVTATTTRVSVDSAGVQGNGPCNWSAISADGRYVVFESTATNLVGGDTNGSMDVFRHDRQTAQTILISVTSTGGQGNTHCDSPDLSDDGRYVVFHSSATNMVANDFNFGRDVFMRDVQLGLTTRLSVDSAGNEVFGGGNHPRISADGRFVAFYSNADALVPNDLNGVQDAFVHDNLTGATSLVSVSSSGAQATSLTVLVDISADGRYVVFYNSAANLVAGDTTAKSDIFVRDTQLGLTTRVSVDSAGAQANGDSFDPTISGDGRFVAFHSGASNLVAGDTNATDDSFRHDRLTGQTVRVSVGPGGVQANAQTARAYISASGWYVAYHGTPSNLVAGDTNIAGDVFVRDVGIAANVTSYCTAGTSTNGCVATMSATGTPSVAASSGFVLTCSSVEGQKSGLIFYGVSGATASAWAPGSTSYLCVKAPTQRTTSQPSGGTTNACDGALSIDLLAWIAANPGALGAPFAPGDTLFSQAWYRDPPAPKTTSLSNAVHFTMTP